MIKRSHELLRRSSMFKREMALQIFEEEDFRLGVRTGKKLAWDGNLGYVRQFYGATDTFGMGVCVGWEIGRAWTVDLEL